jgi:tRNA pseudouridine55 synthase
MSYHGLLLIHKPADITSHDVVYRLRKILGIQEIGHAGTLDPMATGLMVMLVGQGTKLSQYLIEKEKSYRLKARLGYETETLDRTGKVTKEAFDAAAIVAKNLPRMVDQILALQGEFSWPIPMYSAKKIKGKKLYEIAREGTQIESPLKVMKFWDVRIHSPESGVDGSTENHTKTSTENGSKNKLEGSEFEVSLSCSKGSFIRSWVKTLGDNLGCGATLESLERTSSFPFHLDDSIRLEELTERIQRGVPLDSSRDKFFVPLAEMLPKVKRVFIEGRDVKLLRDGLIGHQLRSLLVARFTPFEDELVQIQSQDGRELLALVGLDPEKGFQIRRVFSSQ